MAAADLPGHDPLAGAVADIGIEQAHGGAAQADDLDVTRQRREHRTQRVQLFIGKAARLPGGPARGVDGAVGERQRQRDIVGGAFGAHILDNRKTRHRLRIVRVSPDLVSLREHDRQRAGVKSRCILDAEIDRADLDLGAGLPDEIAAEDIGMQGPDENTGAPQRDARLDQPFANVRHRQRRVRRRPRAVYQPVLEFLQFRCVHDRCICRASSARVKADIAPRRGSIRVIASHRVARMRAR